MNFYDFSNDFFLSACVTAYRYDVVKYFFLQFWPALAAAPPAK
jgi:hypothetical protein